MAKKAVAQKPVAEKQPTAKNLTKGSAKPSAKPSVKMVTVKDLENEYGIKGQTLRVLIRRLGFRAPKNAALQPGEFGPRAKYAWPENSEELKRIRETIEHEFEPIPEEEEAGNSSEEAEDEGDYETEDEDGEDEEGEDEE